MGGLVLAGDDSDFDRVEPGLFEPPRQVAFGEAEPAVAVELSGHFKAMVTEVEDEDLTFRTEDAVGRDQGAGRGLRVMEGLAEDDDVDALRFDGGGLEVAESELQVPEAGLSGLGDAEGDDLLGVVDRDDPPAADGEQFTEQTLARAEIGDDDGREEAEEELAEGLPGASGPIAAVEATGNLVEKEARLVFALGEDAAEVGLVGLVFREFAGPAQPEFDLALEAGVTMPVQAVEGAFAFATGLDQAGIEEEGEVGGDAGLDKGGDLLEFVDGEFSLVESPEEAEAGRIGEGAKPLQRLSHGGWKKSRLTSEPNFVSSNPDTLICPRKAWVNDNQHLHE